MAEIYGLLGPVLSHRLEAVLSLEVATGARHVLTLLPDSSTLVRRVRRGPPVLVVLDPYFSGNLELPLLAWCVRHSVVHGVLVYGGFRQHPIQDVVCLAQVGVRWIVTQDVDDMVLPFRQVLVRALNDLPGRRFLSQLRVVLPEFAFSVVEYTLDRCFCPTSVEAVSRKFGYSSRQLHRRLRDVGLPGPGLLIQWCRCIQAARLLDDESRSLGHVATVLGFSDPANLRRLFRSVTGMTPKQLRDCGGVIALQSLFLSRVSGISATAPPWDRRVS